MEYQLFSMIVMTCQYVFVWKRKCMCVYDDLVKGGEV